MNRCDECMRSPRHPEKKCCFNCDRLAATCEVWHNCGSDCPGWETRIKNNADRIRNMSNEELAQAATKEVMGMCQHILLGYNINLTATEVHALGERMRMHYLQLFSLPASDDRRAIPGGGLPVDLLCKSPIIDIGKLLSGLLEED